MVSILRAARVLTNVTRCRANQGRFTMESRYCKNCGRQRVDGEHFCRDCGVAFFQEAPQPPPRPKVFCSLCGNRVESDRCARCGTLVPIRQAEDIQQIMGGDARKIIGLLAKANDTAFPEESATALRVATDICSKYNITLEQFREWAKREVSPSR